MPNTAEKLMSLDEFLVWEREQPERYEYAGGVVTMMMGSSAAHVTIAMNLAIALRHALRGTGCRPFGSDMKVIANGTARYPDVSVTCHPVGDRDDNIPHPVLVIEVLSPSTEREDRGRKKFDYFATPLDGRDRPGRRRAKPLRIGVEISLNAIYEDTELDTTRRRAEGGPQASAR